jgi:hypothetical protein
LKTDETFAYFVPDVKLKSETRAARHWWEPTRTGLWPEKVSPHQIESPRSPVVGSLFLRPTLVRPMQPGRRKRQQQHDHCDDTPKDIEAGKRGPANGGSGGQRPVCGVLCDCHFKSSLFECPTDNFPTWHSKMGSAVAKPMRPNARALALEIDRGRLSRDQGTRNPATGYVLRFVSKKHFVHERGRLACST